MQSCTGCDLYEHATHAVCGQGKAGSPIALVGEQPGNDEDLKGLPFVGPAGRLLDKALVEVGIDRSLVFVTNAVKHFKFEERGKRRIHKKPSVAEVRACKAWLEAEIEIVRPKVLVCLGATAAQSVMGNQFRLLVERGKPFEHRWAKHVVATVHPSSILRVPEGRDEAYAAFIEDLTVVKKLAAG
jgi:DNA polymerase